MTAFAAVMTGKGTGAISSIQLLGDTSEAILKKIFKPAGAKTAKFKTGKILLGTIIDGTETIDQVIIGCEEPDIFAINCHGNPLIVEMIMQLLRRCGVTLLTGEELLLKILLTQEHVNTIALEAKLIQPKAQTIQATKIIANQIIAGLSKRATEWLQGINEISLDDIAIDAEQILKDSQTAKLIIFGCKAAIVGPPNSGKSTLLNCLSGKQKAIVTDIKGTTRDWVSAQCRIEPLSIEFIDTAGLDETPANDTQKESQRKSVEILQQADLVLLVLDNSQIMEQLDEHLIGKIADKKVLVVLNKIDLPAYFNADLLPENLKNVVQISAKYGNGIENLYEKIRQICGVADFNLHTPVCFTDRQETLLKQLKTAKSIHHASKIISELLNSQA